MILVDTSVWIDHFRRGDPGLSQLLQDRKVMTHPFVIGELALGSLRQRDIILAALRDLPRAPVAEEDEAQAFLDRHRLFGVGIGYVDLHILAGTLLSAGTRLWTRDNRLRTIASRLDVDAGFHP